MTLRQQIADDYDQLFTEANVCTAGAYYSKSGDATDLVGSLKVGDPEARPEVIHAGYLGYWEYTVPVSQISTIDKSGHITIDGVDYKIYKAYKPDDFAWLIILTTETNRGVKPGLPTPR